MVTKSNIKGDNVTKCSVTGCNEEGIQKYDLYKDKPHFMTLILCKKHSKEVNKELEEKYLKVNPDGTYSEMLGKGL